MKGIILAAGLGGRLRAFTEHVPKPMLKVGGIPIIEYSIRLFKKFDITEIIINLHFKPDVITNYLGDGSKLGVKIAYLHEQVLLGTAGAVKNMEHLLNETFVVAYGDTLRADLNIAYVIDFHKEKEADVTIALYRVNDSRGCGIAKLQPDNSVYEFIEKPKDSDKITDGYANCGIYIIESKVLQNIPVGKNYDFASDLFPSLIARGYKIYGCPTDAYILDIGTPDSYVKAKENSHIFKDL